MNRKTNNFSRAFIVTLCVVILLGLAAVLTKNASSANEMPLENEQTDAVVDQPLLPVSYQIDNVKVIPQEVYHAACETYACTMLLQYLGFDMDETLFIENYLIRRDIYYGDDGTRFGPDLNSAYAGDVYTGYGIFAPAMAKSMNGYLETTGSSMRAHALSGVPLEELCEEYVINDIPVMVWATVDMAQPYEAASWVVYYTDENAQYDEGDTFTWLFGQHCLVLIGYDEENYIFADSCAKAIASYSREDTEDIYAQLGTQAIVVY